MSRARRTPWATATTTGSPETTARILAQLQLTLTSPEPITALRALTALRAELDTFEREQVRRALEGGNSFTDVARGLGISRQAAHRRYRSLLGGPPSAPRISAEARAVLQRARAEATRNGAPTVEGEHVVLALVACGQLPGVTVEAARAMIPPRPAGARAPASLGLRLRAALGRIETTIDVADLLRAAADEPAARGLLERLAVRAASTPGLPGQTGRRVAR